MNLCNFQQYSAVAVSVLSNSDFCNCAKILAVFYLPLKSHFTFNNAIARCLNEAGHEVTMITSFPEVVTSENYSRVIDTSLEHYVGQESYDELKELSRIKVLDSVLQREEKQCGKLIEMKEYQVKRV